jgi:hypothetical protein
VTVGIIYFSSNSGEGSLPPKLRKTLKAALPPLIKELKAERFMSIKMTRLAEGEYGSKLPTANVHIEWKEAEYFLPHKM